VAIPIIFYSLFSIAKSQKIVKKKLPGLSRGAVEGAEL